MKERIIETKSKAFALRIIRLYKYLCDEKKEFILSKQVLRSGTSVGANVRESKHAQSDADFIAKLYIALKEAEETLYWLELLHDGDFLTDEQFISIYPEAEELVKILVSTVKTMKGKGNR